jgi:hypothetical protein
LIEDAKSDYSTPHIPRVEILDADVELRDLERELARRRHGADPEAWAKERLGDSIWSGQRRIFESVRDNRRTAAVTCHDVGKALDLDTPLATPTGWTTMRDVQPGDYLFDEDGQPTRVTAVSDIETRPSYRVVFRDGSFVIAADNHLWSVLDVKHRRRNIRDWRNYWDDTFVYTTQELAENATVPSYGNPRWRIPTARPLQTSQAWPLKIKPYAFGAWLGDGVTVRAEMCAHVDDAPFMMAAVNGWEVETRSRENVCVIQLMPRMYLDCPGRETDGKRIPISVLRSSPLERLEVLQGLMDTDGFMGGYGSTINTTRYVCIGLCNEELANDVTQLIESLGWVCKRTEQDAKIYDRIVGTCYVSGFTPDVNPFKLPRKADQWDRNAKNSMSSSRVQWSQRTIAAFEPVGERQVKCVTVDSPRHLYLAGRNLIPTHNSYSASVIASWWIDTHRPGTAFVVTTAPSAPQVKVILWREIGRAFMRGKLKGRLNQTEWYLMVNGREEQVGIGRKPDEYDPSAFQGIHAPHVLVIIDEAGGVRGPLWESADSLIANEGSKILAIGNPDDPAAEFFDICKPGSGWNVVQLSAFESPNFTGEELPAAVKQQLISKTYVEEKRRKWASNWRWTEDGKKCEPPEGSKVADTNPLWQSKILGVFPVLSGDKTLIPIAWVRAAQERVIIPSQFDINELSLDVGGGGDSSVVGHRKGFRFRVLSEDTNPDTMQTCGNLISKLEDPKIGATMGKVDKIGIGRGVVDRAREVKAIAEQNHKKILWTVEGIGVGDGATEEGFINLRAQLWWYTRSLFEAGTIDIDPDDEDLASELASLRFERISSGKIKIESKLEAKSRGVASPNRADALMLAFAPMLSAEVTGLTW